MKLPVEQRGQVDRGHPLLQGGRQHRHARRQPVDRRAARCSRRRTFSGEDASGWQTVLFSTPVPITAGTTYIAGYHAPNGHYSVTSRASTDGVQQPAAAAALADGTAGNGLYRYTATPVLPTNSFNAANYFVDVLYGP